MVSLRPSRSPLTLAALASAAVAGLDPVTTTGLPQHDVDVDAAQVEDTQGRSWVIRAPRSAAAGARLEVEARFVDVLHGWVTFAVPKVVGRAVLPEGGWAQVARAVDGSPVEPARLALSPALAAGFGRTLASVHDLPERLVADCGLPVFEAEEYRQRRLAELDRAAATGKVPAVLLTRWERALEETTAWRFVPTVVHGELDGDSVRVTGTDIVAIVDWAQVRVADPADDLAWLANSADPRVLDAVTSAYRARRRGAVDTDLERRARLAGEFTLVRWLLHGVSTQDDDVVDEAVGMLAALVEATADDPRW